VAPVPYCITRISHVSDGSSMLETVTTAVCAFVDNDSPAVIVSRFPSFRFDSQPAASVVTFHSPQLVSITTVRCPPSADRAKIRVEAVR